MKIQPVRGTRDLIGDQAQLFREIEGTFARLAGVYDFSEIESPIFEPTQTFSRTLGEASDIVNKEMYTFTDRGGDSITLRPEGTASVARAIISNGLQRETPLKFFYRGPMFRYERPQKGRFRQFYQFGVELVGVATPTADIEVLLLAQQLFAALGLQEKVSLELNTIGDDESRKVYREKLVAYFSQHKNKLSTDSLVRLEKNPLRILDSKDEADQELVANAPQFSESLNSKSKEFFAQVTGQLEELGVAYQLNPRLVRGLDYYNHTVWEFTTSHLGSQNAVLSGGRYDNLVSSMGGQDLPGVGWAAGTDRLALLLEKPKEQISSVGIIDLDSEGKSESFKILNLLRRNLISSQIFYSGNVSKKMKKAHKRGCKGVFLIGAEELKVNNVVYKDLATGKQSEVSRDKIIDFLIQEQGFANEKL